MKKYLASFLVYCQTLGLKASLGAMALFGVLAAWASPALATGEESPFETAINPATIIEKIETKLGAAAVPIVGLVVVLLIFGIVLAWIKRHSKGAARGT